MARKGDVDPIGQIGRILKRRFPYLLIVIRDNLNLLERGHLTYYEVLFTLIREAQKFPDLQTILDSRDEIKKTEQDQRAFLYAVQWLDAPDAIRPDAKEQEGIQKRLREINRKYRERYFPDDDQTTTLIPYFLLEDSDKPEINFRRTADLVRRAVLEMYHVMVDHEPERKILFFTRVSKTRKELEDDIFQLAWFLFRCGFGIDRIAAGYYQDSLSEFLHEKLLRYLVSSGQNIRTLQMLSKHLSLISLIDFGSFFELQTDYCGIEDPKEVAEKIKQIKNRSRRGATLLQLLHDLYLLYEKQPNGTVAQRFLGYRYYASFGSYFGDRRPSDPRAEEAVKLYRPLVDESAVQKQTEQDLAESGKLFSSKTREQMADLVRLITESLRNPQQVRGEKVKVLGDISSGAMGKVSIGIYKDRIVALKMVKSDMSQSIGDPTELLQYEAAIHHLVQPDETNQHPNIVEYYGLEDQGGGKILVNGYYPNDSLTQLVEKNWNEKYKPPFGVKSKITLRTLEVIIQQLLECLRHFRERGVVHRDLKTDNILYTVDEKEEVNRIKVIDFGVGLAVNNPKVRDMFKGKVVGTFSYMAPEQARGKSTYGSDLYSAGAIFTVLMTGKLPMVFPKTRTRQELAKQILRIEKELRPRLTELNPWLKRESILENLASLIETMLSLDPMQRPSLEEVTDQFNVIFDEAGEHKSAVSIFYHEA